MNQRPPPPPPPSLKGENPLLPTVHGKFIDFIPLFVGMFIDFIPVFVGVCHCDMRMGTGYRSDRVIKQDNLLA